MYSKDKLVRERINEIADINQLQMNVILLTYRFKIKEHSNTVVCKKFKVSLVG